MKKKLVVAIIVLGIVLGWQFGFPSSATQLDAQVLRAAEYAYASQRQRLKNRRYITIIDYRKSLLHKRLWLYDRTTHQVVLNTPVSHAFRSGLLYATDFSNTEGTNKSCTGTFITLAPYTGQFGYSLRIQGITPGVNTNAKSRAIIFHPDPGLKWSNGCFMTSASANRRLINLIKGGSLVYVVK